MGEGEVGRVLLGRWVWVEGRWVGYVECGCVFKVLVLNSCSVSLIKFS